MNIIRIVTLTAIYSYPVVRWARWEYLSEQGRLALDIAPYLALTGVASYAAVAL